MGVPKRLTEMQKRFAEHLVFGGPDGPCTKTEAATCWVQQSQRKTRRVNTYQPKTISHL